MKPVILPSDIAKLLNDESMSYWLKTAIKSSIWRNPTDALADAKELVSILENQLYKIEAGDPRPVRSGCGKFER